MSTDPLVEQAGSRGRIVIIEYRLIQSDLTHLFEAAGFEVKVLAESELKVGPFRTLCRAWKPDLVISINYRADLALLSTFVHTPYLSWTVDSMRSGQMAIRNGTELASCLLFTHRRDSVAEFKGLDFKDVRQLSLGASHHKRVPIEDAQVLEPYVCPISFVGNSLKDTSAAFLPVLDEHQLERRVSELDTFLENIFQERGHLTNWGGLTDPGSALPEEFLIYVTADNERVQCLESANGRMAHLLRLERVKSLGELGMQVWGDTGWDIDGMNYRGVADHGEQLTKIYNASQINLSIPRLYQRDMVALRTFDVLACGGVLLMEDCAELRNYFTPDEHLFTYTGSQPLAARVQELLAQPEKLREVAENGRKLVLQEHTMEHRFQVILEACCERGWLKPA